MTHSVLLDTSYIIRLLSDNDKQLHQNARDYFKYFLDNEYILKLSTISVAEYCVVGKLDELPLRNLQILPFNIEHAQRAGQFSRILFENKGHSVEQLTPRAIIPNDSKLFAQADTDVSITYYITCDTRSESAYKVLKNADNPKFEIINFNRPFDETFGVLNLK